MSVKPPVKKKPKGTVVRQVPAVSRAIAVLRHLARSETPIGVVQLANALHIIPSTCLHILRVLNSEGLVSFEPMTKKYQLGAGVLALANDFVSKNSLVQVVRPFLEEISRRHRCTTVAVEPSGQDHYIVVAASSINTGVSVSVTVGTRVPFMISATGRCFAAYGNYSLAELKKKFGELRWQNPPAFKTWYEEVQRTREQGYGLDVGNYIAGITIVAAPIMIENETMGGAIVSVCVSDQLKEGDLDTLARDLQRAAARTSAQRGNDEREFTPGEASRRRAARR